MDPKYDHAKVESRIYKMWEAGGYFTPKIDPKKKPFTILLPPPNASGKMHTGNVLMIAIEDLLIRWHRMKGEPTLWIPGTDHAGTETQITFERELKKNGHSRFEYDRETLYKMVWDFVMENKSQIENQIRQMGASVDWTRYKFTLDKDVVQTARSTFQKMAADGLIYRDNYIVNYCPSCGTTYSDIEVEHTQKTDPLYYMKYGPFTIATVRPESKFRDTALAVNPKDKRYKDWTGKTLDILGLLGPITMTVIPDPEVDPKFGTGIMKVTPAHDTHDFQLGKKFNLPVLPIIDLSGRMDFSWFLSQTNQPEKYLIRARNYHGKKVLEARKLMVEDLKADGLLEKTDENYSHLVPTCKAGHSIEPTILPNWFIKVDSLKKPAATVVKVGKLRIFPSWRKATYTRWMEIMHDWAISRQNVWGIRIPAWYNVDQNPSLKVSFLNSKEEVISNEISRVLKKHSFEEIEKGLQTIMAPMGCSYVISEEKPDSRSLQTTETFDTWFSSGQWPLVTLGYPNSEDFKYFYPTTVLETGWEIFSKWVSRMVMFGFYLTKKSPFNSVYLHGMIHALDGRKMSKSLGNVINPDEYLREFGADVLRMGLISGTANGHDFNFPRDKVISCRNFANKVWNIGRFILLSSQSQTNLSEKTDKELSLELKAVVKKVDNNLEKFKFAQAGEIIYHFIWHDLADKYLEEFKKGDISYVALKEAFQVSLRLLHPFMPFVTEEIWTLFGNKTPIIISPWPKG